MTLLDFTRQKRLAAAFGQLYAYPVFGTRISIHRLVPPENVNAFRLLLSSAAKRELPWEALWRICLDVMDDHVQKLWVVDLPKRSRQLGPGKLVFQATPTCLDRIPVGTPACVEDAVVEAERALPGCRLFYLEPAWRKSRQGLELLKPDDIRDEEHRQSQIFRRQASRWAWLNWLAPKWSRSLRVYLYDPIIVAEIRSGSGSRDNQTKTRLVLIAHWD